MAQFSQGFLSSLGRPEMSQSLFGLGAAIGGVPGQMKQRQKEQAFNQLMQQVQAAQGSGDFASMKALSQQMAQTNPQQAAQIMQAAIAGEEKQKRIQAGSGMFSGTPEEARASAEQSAALGDFASAQQALARAEKLEQQGKKVGRARTSAQMLMSEIQGIMKTPDISEANKEKALGLLREAAVAGEDSDLLKPRVDELKQSLLPVKTGSRTSPIEFEVMEEQEDGSWQKITKFAQQDPVTGKLTYETAGPTPPKEFAPNSVKESAALLKIENDLTTEVNELQAKALRAEELADGLEKYDPVGGLQGSLIEYTKEISGQQDAISALRTEASRLTTSAAVANLPKGPASDKDIALVLKGVPPANADAQYLAQYARGVAKMQKAEAQYRREQLNWLSKNRSYQGFNAHMTKKKVEEQFAATNPEDIRKMENNINDPVYRRSFKKHLGYDYVQYKRELEDADSILGGM